ncbi:MAG TPA: GxxExxY protein [Gemmatimonadaceae bacterium]|nr:GxxExxY protein [Gemmatimonadaceae bacterium]
MDVNHVSGAVVDGAMAVHRFCGPGLLERPYHWFLGVELTSRGLKVARQHAVSLTYKGCRVPCAYRIDLVVEGCVAVELKAVKQLLPIHEAQILSYLRLSDLKVGLLINFHERLLKDGIRRFVV